MTNIYYTTYSDAFKTCGHIHSSEEKARLCARRCQEHGEFRTPYLLQTTTPAEAREEVAELGIWQAAKERRDEESKKVAERRAAKRAAGEGSANSTGSGDGEGNGDSADGGTDGEGQGDGEGDGEGTTPGTEPDTMGATPGASGGDPVAEAEAAAEAASDDDAPSVTGAMGAFGVMSGAMIEKAIDAKIDGKLEPFKEEITELVKDVAKELTPRSVEIKVNDAEPVELDEMTHPVLEQMIELALCGKNIMLIGPSGCGKTHVAAQLGRALKRRYGSASCSNGLSESAFVGRLLPTGDGGKFEYSGTELTDMVENGGVYLVDESDGADANLLLCLNQLASNRRLPIPLRIDDPYIEAHEDFTLCAAMNTWGNGSTRMYCGRNAQDKAWLNRFGVGTLEMDYHRPLERQLAQDDELCEVIWKLRTACDDNRIQQIVSTRYIIDAADMRKRAGWTLTKCVEQLALGWTDDEKRRAGVPAILEEVA